MIKCSKCEAMNKDDSNFCIKCGTKIDATVCSPAFQSTNAENIVTSSSVSESAAQQSSPAVINNFITEKKGNGIGTAGFVIALISVLFSWVPVFRWILWVPGALLSCIGLFRTPRGLAIAGTVISFFDLIILIVLLVAAVSAGGSLLGGLGSGLR